MTVQHGTLDREAILRILSENDNVKVLVTGNPGKQVETVRILEGDDPVLTIKDLATLLQVEPDQLESDESEQGYAAIAEGKVRKAMEAALASEVSATLLLKMILVGDDYGAAVGALTFTHDPNAEAMEIDFDGEGHITAIRTNRAELGGEPEPGYFSKRIMLRVAEERGITLDAYQKQVPETYPDAKAAKKAFKKAAFEALAKEIQHHAEQTGDRSTTATVAVASVHVKKGSTVNTVVKTADYILVDADKMPDHGFDFDRMQRRAGEENTIADWSDDKKDQDFPRGIAMNASVSQTVGVSRPR